MINPYTAAQKTDGAMKARILWGKAQKGARLQRRKGLHGQGRPLKSDRDRRMAEWQNVAEWQGWREPEIVRGFIPDEYKPEPKPNQCDASRKNYFAVADSGGTTLPAVETSLTTGFT